MPVIHRQRLAARLRQNWSTMYSTQSPSQSSLFQTVDDSLTSLAWLQNLNVMKLSTANAAVAASAARSAFLPGALTSSPGAVADDRPRSGNQTTDYRRCQSEDSAAIARLQVDPNDILDMTNKRGRSPVHDVTSNWGCSAVGVNGGGAHGGVDGVFDEAASAASQLERDRYRDDASIKPPYSYAMLICMAMQETPDKRITLAQIYSWIADNFAYYKQADQNWQHSIRHNLSLNKCFQKVPRGKDEPGKGGFWTINPEFNNLVDRGIFKRRRLTFPTDSSSSIGSKKEPASSTPEASCSIRSRSSSMNPSINASGKEEDKISDPVLDFRTDSLTDVLDLHWALDQDIEIGGLSVKTGDIIDMHVAPTPQLFVTTSLESPPPSDSDSELELSSLLNFSAFHPVSSHPGVRGEDSLDLTIHGVGLPPPDWWNESLNGHFPSHDDLFSSVVTQSDGRMHTPSLSRFDDDNFHPWAENRNEEISDVMLAFDSNSDLIDPENLDVSAGFKLL